MNRRPERLADLLPAVVADLAARHNTTNGAPMTTLVCHICDELLDDLDVAAISGHVVVCNDCAALAEPVDGAA